MTSEEVATAGTEEMRQSPITEPVMEMSSTETMTMVTSDMNDVEMTEMMTEQANMTIEAVLD